MPQHSIGISISIVVPLNEKLETNIMSTFAELKNESEVQFQLDYSVVIYLDWKDCL